MEKQYGVPLILLSSVYYKNIIFTYVIQAIFHSRIRTAYLEWHISPKLAKTHITP